MGKKKNSIGMSGSCRFLRRIAICFSVWFGLHLEKTTFSPRFGKLTVEVIPVKAARRAGEFFCAAFARAGKTGDHFGADSRGCRQRRCRWGGLRGFPRLVDTHKPGSFTVQHFSSMRWRTDSVNLPSAAAPVIALRIFRPALETSVELDGRQPHFVRLWHRHRRVLAASGPWSQFRQLVERLTMDSRGMGCGAENSCGLGYYRIYRDRIREAMVCGRSV